MAEATRKPLTSRRDVTLDVPWDAWTDVRGDRAFLKTVLWLNGTPLHLEAVEVQSEDGGALDAVAEEDRERLEALDQVYPARWQTMSVCWPGEAGVRAYVAYAVPFGR